MATQEYIAATIPAKTDRVSGTTLFHLAMLEFGDPLQWVPIAQLNNFVDPWIFGQTDVLIPPVLPSVKRVLPEIGGQPFVTPFPPIILVPDPAAMFLSALSPPAVAFFFNSVSASLVLAGVPPTIGNKGSPNLSPAAGSPTLTGVAPTLLHSIGLVPAAAQLTLTGQSSQTPLGLQPAVASLALSGTTSTIAFSMNPGVASLALAGVAPTVAITQNPKLQPAAASLSLAPQSPVSPVLIAWSGPTNGLTNRWSFDPSGITGGTTVLDLVGSLNLTITPTTTQVNGPPGGFNAKALQFDGSTGYIDLSSLTPLPASGPFSVGFFVVMSDITYQEGGGSNDQVFFGLGTSGSSHTWKADNAVGGGLPGYLFWGTATSVNMNGTGENTLVSTAQQFSNNTWAHVVVTWDGTANATVYVNGRSITMNGSSFGLSGTASNAIARGHGQSNFLKGALYQMCVYNRVLSATDVSNLYAAG